ncbi:MAG: flagellar biosynthesis regulator FlaF [Rhodospirillales bacterium]|nr:flagellar biosynthesis regulator FlaF [Rhodospirillales bacterium]
MYPSHQKSALDAYQRTQNSAMSPRQLEVLAFNRAASRLRQAGENIHDFAAYIAALTFNQRLWTAIQAGLMEDDGRVPEPVRSNMLNLSLFIDRHTLDAIRKPAAGKIQALIEINRAMADGLADNARRQRTLN